MVRLEILFVLKALGSPVTKTNVSPSVGTLFKSQFAPSSQLPLVPPPVQLRTLAGVGKIEREKKLTIKIPISRRDAFGSTKFVFIDYPGVMGTVSSQGMISS